MKKSILYLILILCSNSIFPNGVAKETLAVSAVKVESITSNGKYLSKFISLFDAYCYQHKSNEEVEKIIKREGTFAPHQEYKNTFLHSYMEVDYALTLEERGECTVDVSLVYKDDVLFTEKEIIKAIENLTGFFIEREDIERSGIKNTTNVLVRKTTLRNKTDSDFIVLSYPLDNPDKYYMYVSYYFSSLIKK
ncbi:MAG: hypothetical protein ABW098_16585 [Candidatus Thiodiazotropha sp.]